MRDTEGKHDRWYNHTEIYTLVFLFNVAVLALSCTVYIFKWSEHNSFANKNVVQSEKDFKVTNQRLRHSKSWLPLREGRSNSPLAESKHQLSPVGTVNPGSDYEENNVELDQVLHTSFFFLKRTSPGSSTGSWPVVGRIDGSTNKASGWL